MLDVMMSFIWPEGMAPFAIVADDREEARAAAHDMIFETSDGYVTLGAVSNKEWIGLCTAIGRPDLIEDARFATPAARSTNRQERMETVEAALGQQRTEDLIAALEANDVPCMPVLRRREALEDAQIKHNGIVVEIDQPGLGAIRQARPAALFGATPANAPRPAPGLGEHSAAVLAEAGYSAAEIDGFAADGVIKRAAPRT